SMAVGNTVALFLFSSRNNVLLYLTDWSCSTHLLLHHWLGYWTALHTIIHPAMLWSYYSQAGTYLAELKRLCWQWGIVGTATACALIPFSLLKVRKMFHELFITSHVVLSLLSLIGYHYHVWYVYTYNWGYEIWMFVAAGIWALEHVLRIGQMTLQGSSMAVFTVVPDVDGEHIQIGVEGRDFMEGVV
ncbi:hypothetical protein P154DRAFT_587384, partial [Amniculicola lignicola CBS 123094]